MNLRNLINYVICVLKIRENIGDVKKKELKKQGKRKK